jgi:uncharacterized protein YjiS (DUF1127 family)
MSTPSVSSGTHAFLPAQISKSHRKPESRPTPKSRLRQLPEMLRDWRGRIRSRRELAAMSQLDLKDLGYPAGVDAEKHKPFWRS